jgi:hypothetical protein
MKKNQIDKCMSLAMDRSATDAEAVTAFKMARKLTLKSGQATSGNHGCMSDLEYVTNISVKNIETVVSFSITGYIANQCYANEVLFCVDFTGNNDKQNITYSFTGEKSTVLRLKADFTQTIRQRIRKRKGGSSPRYNPATDTRSSYRQNWGSENTGYDDWQKKNDEEVEREKRQKRQREREREKLAREERIRVRKERDRIAKEKADNERKEKIRKNREERRKARENETPEETIAREERMKKWYAESEARIKARNEEKEKEKRRQDIKDHHAKRERREREREYGDRQAQSVKQDVVDSEDSLLIAYTCIFVVIILVMTGLVFSASGLTV